MSFIQRWNVDDICRQIRAAASQASDPRNDGWTASGCKQDLFQVKCLLDDLYADLPKFAGEEAWEQQRLVDLLKR